MKKNIIFIDPRCRINYASYYIKGFFDFFDKKNIKFDTKPFLSYNLFSNENDYRNYMLIQVQNGNVIKNIVIDFGDSSNVSNKHYEWCDVYAKINILNHDLNTKSKIIAIGPSFGINYTNYLTLKLLIKSFFIKNRPVSFNDYLKNFFYMQIRRLKYEKYLGSDSKSNYIFAVSTLWYDPLTFKTTNYFRIIFYSICKKIVDHTEGGFFYIKDKSITNKFPEYAVYKEEIQSNLFNKRISPSEYIRKTKDSTIVFNTPSVMSCHGWKLGEYFAMGKAVISTPLINEMPEELVDNKTLFFVDSEESIEKGVKELVSNPKLRMILEKNTFEYFQKNLSPTAVVGRIIRKLYY